MSNLVIGGSKTLDDLSTPYASLVKKHGVTVVQDHVTRIDTDKKTITLANGPTLPYDKLVLSPGVEMMFDTVDGLKAAHDSGRILQAWKAGEETTALRKQLQDMPDGGVYALTVPESPYRCPPGPYERASQVAHYFKQAKPKSKVLILDANPDVTSKGPLFKKFWSENYKDSTSRKIIVNDDGTLPTTPVCLNGSGAVLANPSPTNAVFGSFNIYPAYDFNLLPLS